MQVFILRRAVAGVSNEVRAFPEWKEEHEKSYREPPRDFMVTWRQRLADCFGFNFTQVGQLQRGRGQQCLPVWGLCLCQRVCGEYLVGRWCG